MTSCLKLLLLGDGGVGKTTLVQRYVTGSFTQGTKMTIGAEFHVKALVVDGEDVALQVWDLGGEERFRFILPSFCAGAAGAIFAYDVTRYDSLLHAGDWMEVLHGNASGIPVVMVGTKADLTGQRVVGIDMVEAKARELGIARVFEVSAKTGDNVEQVFEAITRLMLASPTSPKFPRHCEQTPSY